MRDIEQSLETVKALYEEVVGTPAPDVEPESYAPFPPGADPDRLVDAEVEELTRVVRAAAAAPTPFAWIPPVDTVASGKGLVFQVDVPGVTRDELEVFVAGGELVVRGIRKAPALEKDTRPVAVERMWGPFERRIPLPAGADSEEVAATCRDGVLELRIAVDTTSRHEERKVRVA